MGALRGAAVGAFGLITLYNFVSAPTSGILTAASLPGRLAHYLVSPDVPLVPDRSNAAGATRGGIPVAGSSSSSPTGQPSSLGQLNGGNPGSIGLSAPDSHAAGN